MVSVVISAYNEEAQIKECIESVKNIAAEIIVVDNSSTDRTAEIAKKAGAIVFSQENDYKKIDLQKNFGFEKAREEWILSLDADERLTPKLSEEIRKIVSSETLVNGFNIPRKNIIFGKWIKHSIWWPDYQLRLFRKGKGKFLKSTVHQPIDVKGEVRHVGEPLVHQSYTSIFQFVNRMNAIYTDIEAEELVKSGKKLKTVDALKMPLSDFLKTFFLQQGYKDGLHGLVLSMLQSFYMFLVFAKMWEKQGFHEKSEEDVLDAVQKESLAFGKDMKYWLYNILYARSVSPVKKILYLVSKKLL
ncbi:MAG: glycosyltransferase family 2 protein [Candidatus Levyibacteriota bacterium]